MKFYTRDQKSEIRGQIAIMTGFCFLLVFMPACRQGNFAATKAAQIYVATDPAEAMLFCDSVNRGKTPATISPVAPGEHLLNIRKAGYREIRATVTTRPGERLALELSLEALKGLVLVRSAPEGADVELDGANIGKTPLFSRDFPLGQRRLQISRPGYLSKVINLNVEDRTPIKVDVLLASDSAELAVESSPAGALVTMDNSVIGTTPLTLSGVKTGKHALELTLKGYASAQHEITLQVGEKQNVSSTLKPLPGKLTLLSTPPRARVYLDNQFKAETPFSITNIPSGQYVIRAELRGYDPQSRTNQITSGEESTVEFQMVKSSGILIISTFPPGVDFYLDGELRGTTKARRNEQISDKMQVDFVPRGPHKLQFTKQGYLTLQRALNIRPNQMVILHETLALRPVPFVPNMIIRTGNRPEQTFRGVVRETFANGDIKMEVEPGIFRTFGKVEIIFMEKIPAK